MTPNQRGRGHAVWQSRLQESFIGRGSAIHMFYPNALGHPDNYIPANPMSTPAQLLLQEVIYYLEKRVPFV